MYLDRNEKICSSGSSFAKTELTQSKVYLTLYAEPLKILILLQKLTNFMHFCETVDLLYCGTLFFPAPLSKSTTRMQ